MTRATGTVTTDWLARAHQVYFYFLKVVWPDTTWYWSNFSSHKPSITLNIDGTSRAWDCTQVWEPGDFTQNDQTPLAVNDLTFGNADNVVAMKIRKYGWRDRPVTVWIAYFDEAPPFVLRDSFVVYDGTGDRSESSDLVRASLLPYKPPFLSKFPRRLFTPGHGFNYIPQQNMKFPWGNVTAQAPPAPQPGQTGPGGGGNTGIPVQVPGSIGSSRGGVVPPPRRPPPRIVPPR